MSAQSVLHTMLVVGDQLPVKASMGRRDLLMRAAYRTGCSAILARGSENRPDVTRIWLIQTRMRLTGHPWQRTWLEIH